jgi:predicted Zn-dependent peptidase
MKLEELRRIPDDPQKLAFRNFGRLVHEGSPRGRLATTLSVSRIHREDLVRFHEQRVRPGRIMLSISGDIDNDEAQRFVRRYFGSWQSPALSEAPLPPAKPGEGKLFTLLKEGPQAIVLFGWQAPAKKSSDFFPMEIIDFIVGSGGFRSRIFQEIRTNRGLAYSTGSFFTARSDYGVFGAYALTKSESTLEVISLLRGIMRDVSQKPPTQKELEMTKRSILNSHIFSFTSSNQIVLQQLMTEFEGLQEAYLETYPANIAGVTAAEVKETAGRHLDPDKAIILVVGNSAVCKQISESFKDVERIENPL